LLINRFQFSPETAAWKMLVTKYDNKRALIHTHIHSFASLSRGKSESATELKKLRDTVSVALSALSNLVCHVSHWDPILVYLITEKFGPKTWMEWNLKHGDTKEYTSYQEIDVFLSFHIRGLSMDGSVTDSLRNKSRSSVNGVSLKCINCIGSHKFSKLQEISVIIDQPTQYSC